jgi:lysophospholipase L1-like esterase
MDVRTTRFATPRPGRSLPRVAPLALTSALLLGAGALAGTSVRAAARVRRMRAAGREVPPLDHDTSLPGRDPVRRLVVVGDSAAAGHGLAEADQAFTRIVAGELTDRDGRATRIVNVAVDGATIRHVLDHQVHALEDAEVVIACVGVNDAIRRRRLADIDADMRELLGEIRHRAAPGAAITLITAPDLSLAPELPSILRPPLGVRCRAVARIQGRVAAEFGVPVIELPKAALPPEVFGEDGFHPGPIGHARLAEGVLARLPRAVG